jgi:DNA-binding transcriptional ArsR family regulator
LALLDVQGVADRVDADAGADRVVGTQPDRARRPAATGGVVTAAVAPLLPPLVRRRVRLTPAQYVELYGPMRRVDRLVLLDLARHADYNAATWGERAHPRVGDKGRGKTTIGERIGYSERSVQYALRRLEAGGWVDRLEQPGRVSVYRIVRKVEPVGSVDTEPEIVDDVGDNRPPADPSPPLDVAPGGAKVAPDLEPVPREPPPLPPSERLGSVDGATAPAQSAPERRGAGPPRATRTDPPSAAEHRAEPLRRDAGATDVATVLRALPGGWAERDEGPPDGTAESDPTSERWSRSTTRARRCPRCGADPGQACRGRRGRLRQANHADRRLPRV